MASGLHHDLAFPFIEQAGEVAEMLVRLLERCLESAGHRLERVRERPSLFGESVEGSHDRVDVASDGGEDAESTGEFAEFADQVV